MESESLPSEFPPISTPKFWNYLQITKDKQVLLNYFYKSLKKLTVKDVNDTVLNNIQQMFGIILEHRKYYRDENINSLKSLKEKDDELKYANHLIEILKQQKEDGINAIKILQSEIKKYVNELFKAEQALIKTKQEAEEDAKATKEAITDAFKNELNELFDLREKYEILQRNSATLIEEKNAKNEEIERFRNASLKLIAEKKVQNEINESLNIQIENLQNDLKVAEKEIEIFNERKISFNKILEMTKNAEEKSYVEKDALKAEYNDKIAKMEEEIRQLNAKSDADKISLEAKCDSNKITNQAWTNNITALFKEKDNLIEMFKFELQKMNKALQNQILMTAATQKELNLLKSETEAQQEGRCEIQKLPNRKRPNILENKKSAKQKKDMILNQENHPFLSENPPASSKIIHQHLPSDIYCQQQQYFMQQQNLSCQNPHLQNSSRQPFQQIENIPSGYHPQQPQPICQIPTSENVNPNFYHPFNFHVSSLQQFQQYLQQQFPSLS